MPGMSEEAELSSYIPNKLETTQDKKVPDTFQDKWYCIKVITVIYYNEP